MTATIKVKVQRKPTIKLKVLPRFPSNVTATSPITLDRTGGNYGFGFDMSAVEDSIAGATGITSLTLGDTFLIGGSSLRSIPVQNVLTNIPAWYGAKGDGVTDDRAAIQTAIDALPTGGKLRLAHASVGYLLNSVGTSGHCISIVDKSITIEGDSYDINTNGSYLPRGSIFMLGPSIPSTADIIHFSGTRAVFGAAIRNVAFTGVTNAFHEAPVGRDCIRIEATGANDFYHDYFRMEGVFICNMAAGLSFHSVATAANHGGGALCNSVIKDTTWMNSKFEYVGDNITLQNITSGQNATVDSRNVGCIANQIGGATSFRILGGNWSNSVRAVSFRGGIAPEFDGLEVESSTGAASSGQIDIIGDISKVFGGSAINCSVSNNNAVDVVYPFRVDTSEGFSVFNNRIATLSPGGVHILVTANAVNPQTNGNYCTTGGVVVDCLVSNSSGSINSGKINIGTANGTDLINLGGFGGLSGLHLNGASSGVFTFLPPATGGGSFRFSSGTSFDMASTGPGVLKQTLLGGVMTVAPVAVSEISGLGTGVATALAVNVGTAGSPVVNGGVLGTPSSCVATNLTGTASGLTAGHVTTNANLTGDVTSVGNAATLAAGNAGNLNSGTLLAARMPALTGDITTIAGAVGTTLATGNPHVGSFGDATHAGAFTVNAKGLITSAASTAITGTPPGGAAGGLLAGTYPNPTLAIPYFLAQMTADQTVTTGVFAVVSFDSETYDSNSWYDPATFKFTPQRAGKYLVTVQITGTGTVVSAVTAAIAKNGTSVITGSGATTASGTVSGNMVSMIVDMNGSTDFIQAGAIVLATGTAKVAKFNPSIGQTGTWFQAHFISP